MLDRITADADITPLRERRNLDRLAAALRELDARVYTESVPDGLPFDCTAAMLSRADLWNLITSAGRLDVAFSPAGTGGYEDLSRSALRGSTADIVPRDASQLRRAAHGILASRSASFPPIIFQP